MGTTCVNMIERGDKVVIGAHGVFGTRMAHVTEKCGAVVIKVIELMGRAIDAAEAFSYKTV